MVESALNVDICKLVKLCIGLLYKLPSFFREISGLRIGLRTHRDIFARSHCCCTGN